MRAGRGGTDVELIRDRLNAAREDYRQRYGKGAK